MDIAEPCAADVAQVVVAIGRKLPLAEVAETLRNVVSVDWLVIAALAPVRRKEVHHPNGVIVDFVLRWF